jgi:hypothetical protein
MVTDRAFTNTVKISTSSAHQLLGTIHLPNAQLPVGGAADKLADQSPWTIVVSKGIQIEGLAQRVIDSRCFVSTVPVPVALVSTEVRLAR